MSQATTTPVRRMISILIMLLLLGTFLSVYFFKYVPGQKREYNERAFRELLEVSNTFRAKTTAYLEQFKSKHSDSVTTAITNDSSYNWMLTFQWRQKKQKRSLDSIMLPLTAGDNDVFDSYLMMLDDTSCGNINAQKHIRDNHLHGEIIFNPDKLSIGTSVCTDTLLRRNDGFSLMNIRDVTVEGNDYKLFYCPFRFYEQTITIAGLLSRAHYTHRYESVPVDFFVTGAVLLLLLLVAIPLLKIYIIGSHERISTIDLRLIIGTYFVGGFVIFVLFAWSSLEGSQTDRNKKFLRNFAARLETSFYNEIDTACRELKHFDALYNDSTDIRSQLTKTNYDASYTASLHARYYRQLRDVFWIDTNGRWVARYGFMHYDDLRLQDFSDRRYFKDMKAGNILHLKNSPDSFCLQPTLSRIDGSFVANIVIPSHTAALPKGQRAIMVGLASEMYSVCNTVLPPGYGFSIIDGMGNILFDHRERSLLTNIYPDLSNREAIGNCVLYRQERFLSSTSLHGTEVALLSTPMEQLPYTMLVYYELGRDQQFQLHVLGSSCLFIGCIILFLILSAYCNEWVRGRASLSSIPPVNFEWLRPVPAKRGYYRHLVKGMAGLAIVYALPWLTFSLMDEKYSFYLFVTSILFPFYLAIYYVLLRERQKPEGKRLEIPALLGALGIPILIILIVMSYLLPKDPAAGNRWLAVATQLALASVIAWSLKKFDRQATVKTSDKTLTLFVRAVVAGVLLTVIVPALGIFRFFYIEESIMRAKTEKLAMSGLIDNRQDSLTIGQSNYSFDTTDNVFLHDLKFKKGIYLPDGTVLCDRAPAGTKPPTPSPEMFYAFHTLLFPGDTTLIMSGDAPETASDTSWSFQKDMETDILVRNSTWDNEKTRICLPMRPVDRQSAITLMFNSTVAHGPTNFILFFLIVSLAFGLLYWLTGSLANRLFLLRFFDKYPKEECRNDNLNKLTATPGSGKLLQKIKAAGLVGRAVVYIRRFEEKNPDYNILHVQTELRSVYHRIWDGLPPREKFVLYDFAVDGLINYKAGMPLFNLIQKGILCLGPDDQLHIMTHSFHNYVLNQSGNKAIIDQMKMAREQGSWQNFKIPLFIILTATGLFIFFTQDATYQKITGLFTSLSSLIPLVSRLFEKGNK